jgi:SAM-dependent methyltransferase
MSKLEKFDRHAAYARAVQSPDVDARFLRKIYRDLVGQEPRTMREDFCGTFALCCEWAGLDQRKLAIGLDIDQKTIQYGREHYLQKLPDAARKRVTVLLQNVLAPNGPRANIICALNFSYYAIRDRDTLLRYFKQCRASLAPNGLLVLDAFGGPSAQEISVEDRSYPGLKYFWEQKSFDPITNRGQFLIHFKRPGERKRLNVFTYDWRLWSIPELRDIMEEAGFKESVIYWEGTTRTGSGSGHFHRRRKGEPDNQWVAYIVARK